ncbi:MAG TPA: cytochrome P460 family protein [Burkholderiales bacterium]|nr:cytochrome P460 family protein [Burkholderiales bacterium]
MKKLVALLAVALSVSAFAQDRKVPPTANGIALPAGYKDWQVIAVSQRADSNTLRAIVGNDVAVKAARAGKTNPWPEGAVIGKIVWKNAKDPLWAPATVPGEIVHVEFMLKDSKAYASTGTWGYARWRGMQLEPYSKDATANGAAAECFACHGLAKGQDYVFTKPAALP